MTVRNNSATRRKCGFTMPESLLVFAIIGILTGLALPMFFSIPSKGAENKAMRNAQYLASLAAAAIAAGDESIPAAISEEDAVQILVNGVSVGQGPYGMTFKSQPMSEDEITSAIAHLVLDSGVLLYQPNFDK